MIADWHKPVKVIVNGSLPLGSSQRNQIAEEASIEVLSPSLECKPVIYLIISQLNQPLISTIHEGTSYFTPIDSTYF